MSDIPIPLSNYLNLIHKKKSPYYDLLRYIVADMERQYVALEYPVDMVYTINPRRLQKEAKAKIESEKLTTMNVARTILAILIGSRLKKGEDYYVTTSSGGRRNYHIRLNSAVLATLRSNL